MITELSPLSPLVKVSNKWGTLQNGIRDSRARHRGGIAQAQKTKMNGLLRKSRNLDGSDGRSLALRYVDGVSVVSVKLYPEHDCLAGSHVDGVEESLVVVDLLYAAALPCGVVQNLLDGLTPHDRDEDTDVGCSVVSVGDGDGLYLQILLGGEREVDVDFVVSLDFHRESLV